MLERWSFPARRRVRVGALAALAALGATLVSLPCAASVDPGALPALSQETVAQAPDAGSPQGQPDEPRFFLYSETDYLSLTDNVVTQNQLHLSVFRLPPALNFYAGLVFEQDLRSNAIDIYNDNNISPLVGASYTFQRVPVTAFAEMRETLRLINRPLSRSDEQPDARAGLFLYDWRDLARLGRPSGKPLTLFNEVYAEGVFSSRLDDDVFAQGWNKLGARWVAGRSWWIDGLVEGLFRRDRIGDPGDNLEAVGPGLRVTAGFSPIFASFYVRRAFGSFDGGYHSGPYAESTGQLVLSGEF